MNPETLREDYTAPGMGKQLSAYDFRVSGEYEKNHRVALPFVTRGLDKIDQLYIDSGNEDTLRLFKQFEHNARVARGDYGILDMYYEDTNEQTLIDKIHKFYKRMIDRQTI